MDSPGDMDEPGTRLRATFVIPYPVIRATPGVGKHPGEQSTSFGLQGSSWVPFSCDGTTIMQMAFLLGGISSVHR